MNECVTDIAMSSVWKWKYYFSVVLPSTWLLIQSVQAVQWEPAIITSYAFVVCFCYNCLPITVPFTNVYLALMLKELHNNIKIKYWAHHAKRSLMSWVVAIPKEGLVQPRVPILLLVWQWLRTLGTFSHHAACMIHGSPGYVYSSNTLFQIWLRDSGLQWKEEAPNRIWCLVLDWMTWTTNWHPEHR